MKTPRIRKSRSKKVKSEVIPVQLTAEDIVAQPDPTIQNSLTKEYHQEFAAPAAAIKDIATPAAPVSVRTASIRRSAEGKFNKQNLTLIGGSDCKQFYSWGWLQRDKFMSLDTVASRAVKGRYLKHMATIKPKV